MEEINAKCWPSNLKFRKILQHQGPHYAKIISLESWSTFGKFKTLQSEIPPNSHVHQKTAFTCQVMKILVTLKLISLTKPSLENDRLHSHSQNITPWTIDFHLKFHYKEEYSEHDNFTNTSTYKVPSQGILHGSRGVRMLILLVMKHSLQIVLLSNTFARVCWTFDNLYIENIDASYKMKIKCLRTKRHTTHNGTSDYW